MGKFSLKCPYYRIPAILSIFLEAARLQLHPLFLLILFFPFKDRLQLPLSLQL